MGTITMQDALYQFRGKRVFVTGHTGFKGSWLTFLLQELGANVLGYALAPEEKSHFNHLKLEHDITHITGDICDEKNLIQTMQNFQPEYVFHLAAQALVRKSYTMPTMTVATNVSGSAHLLEAVRLCDSVRSLVYITSDKCYENREWVWGYREMDQLGGHDLYSASKAAAEIIFAAYAKSFYAHRPKLGAATTRAGNVIGGGDWAKDRIIPDCIRAIEHNKTISLRNPNATRPWQHVLEPLSGYLLLAAHLYNDPENYAGSWNFGPSTQEVRTVHDVTKTIIHHFGQGKIETEQTQSNLHEAQLLQLNCDKAHQLLGWQPRWDVDKTLTATAVWYKEIFNDQDARDISRRQIYDYFSELR